MLEDKYSSHMDNLCLLLFIMCWRIEQLFSGLLSARPKESMPPHMVLSKSKSGCEYPDHLGHILDRSTVDDPARVVEIVKQDGTV